MWLDSQTFSSEALPELETLSKMSAPGKVNITKLDLNCVRRASLNLIHFSLLFFFNCLFLIILYFFSIFIDLLIKEGKEKLKTIFFVFQKITQSDDLTRPINLRLRKDDDNEGKVSSLLRFFSLKQINAVTFDWLKEMRQKKWRFHRPAMPFLFVF